MMSKVSAGERLNAIGQHVANIIGKVPQDLFLYMGAGDQFVEAAIFDNLPDEVVYFDPTEELEDEILALWEDADADKKWAIALYDIKDGQFSVVYLYPEQFESEDEDDDKEYEYQDIALFERYGDKPIRYPPEDGDFRDFTEDGLADT